MCIRDSFTGTKEKTPITIDGKQLTPSDKESLVTLCLDTDLKVSWISQIDVKAVPEHTSTLAFVDGIAVGKDKVYIAGRGAGAFCDAEGNVILEQKVKGHRGYALAIDKATGKPNAEWHTLLPEKGISNCTAISTPVSYTHLDVYKRQASGKADATDNVIKNAPHPQYEVCADEWHHAYTRQQAAFALPYLEENKFWVNVARIDNGFGDRNLIPAFCACTPEIIDELNK